MPLDNCCHPVDPCLLLAGGGYGGRGGYGGSGGYGRRGFGGYNQPVQRDDAISAKARSDAQKPKDKSGVSARSIFAHLNKGHDGGFKDGEFKGKVTQLDGFRGVAKRGKDNDKW